MSTKSIQSNTYIISDNSQQHLFDLGFHRIFTYDEEYIYNFPILKYKKITVLTGKITASIEDNRIKIDVLDRGILYSPFYNNEYGNREVIMDKINKNILSEFKKLGIKRKQKEKKSNNE